MEAKQRNEELLWFPTERAAYLAKWLWVLFFWSLFSGIAIVAVQTDPVQILIQLRLESIIGSPDLVPVALRLTGIGGAAFLFVKLGRVSYCYRCTAFWLLLLAVVNLVLVGKGSNSPTWWAMNLLGLVAAVGRSHQSYHGHAELLDGLRPVLAKRWRRLWVWCIGLILGLPVGSLVARVFPSLGGNLLAVSVLGLAVVEILELICLWKTAAAFQKDVLEAVLPDADFPQ